ncbi:hypothetical protein [Sphingomonas sp.]
MFRFLRSGFARHFLSGFAIGAVGLVALQSAEPPAAPLFPPASAAESTH